MVLYRNRLNLRKNCRKRRRSSGQRQALISNIQIGLDPVTSATAFSLIACWIWNFQQEGKSELDKLYFGVFSRCDTHPATDLLYLVKSSVFKMTPLYPDVVVDYVFLVLRCRHGRYDECERILKSDVVSTPAVIKKNIFFHGERPF